MSSEESKIDEISVKSGNSSILEDNVENYRGFDDAADERVKGLARQLTEASESNSVGRGSLTQEEIEEGRVVPNYSRQLVRTLTSMSEVPGVSTFQEGIDPRLDPNSDEFNSKFWIKNLRKLIDSDPDYYKPASLGIAYKDLRAYGIAVDADYQTNVINAPFKVLKNCYDSVLKRNDKSRYFDILKPMDALIKPGEVTVVLGRPGAGCSTLLKTIAAQTHGFHVAKESQISYDGISTKDIKKFYRGDVIYSAETDVHFPHLRVGDTLEFAARMRTPQNRVPGVDREAYAKHLAAVYMATYGLTHTYNTKVGNDLVRGVSGGERKRVSIAEVALSGASLQCWDNATRGLDAATALEFIKALKTSAMILDATPLIAIYQCSQDSYDLFDNVIVLYEGYQIYFGPGNKAKRFFLNMGYDCPPRQTTADFLTSLTNPVERVAKKGFENKVPKTPKEFSEYWRASPEYQELIKEIDSYLEHNKITNTADEFKASHVARQSRHMRPRSPYTVSYFMQVRNIMKRNFLRLQGDPSVTIFSVFGNSTMAFILSSIFYNLPKATQSFYYRGAAMFLAVLFNSFASLLEIMSLFEARRIVEKHKQFALYHPSADALASVMSEVPPKLLTSIAFNLIYYFLVNFRREPGRFFFYFLMNIVATFAMSHLFRTIGAASTSLPQAMTPASVLLLGLTIFTGFVIPTTDMLGWSRWINYINPIGYVFEALMANEFNGVTYECSDLIPSGGSYDSASLTNRVCSVVGSISGQDTVSGTRFLNLSYEYYDSHRWRNFGIAIAFVVFFLFIYLTFTEFNEASKQKGEVILFQQGTLRKLKKEQKAKASIKSDLEATSTSEKISVDDQLDDNNQAEVGNLVAGKDIFHWRDVCYDIKIKNETRRILNSVDGWVKPGTLTALMGASGAGKTTLLDVLANRVTMGVVTGDMFVNGRLRDSSFQRSTGYVQQQDLHLQTSTVREALLFSAYLRQPASISKAEKEAYVEDVIKVLEMTKYADAVVGVAGEGLNVEQRKRLTIGVELAAKPKLLLFLDEPTSGLDSQTAWSICQLMRKLANHGQAILCTIHQPSAILLQEFDRLLFLAKGGKTIYFGDLGKDCETLINYFENHGSDKFPADCNPAEFMLEIIGAAPGSHAKQDYHEVWKNSEEHKRVQIELDDLERNLIQIPIDSSPEAHKEFATSILFQYFVVTKRVFQQYWRTPTYLWSKFFLCVSSSLFNGFSFFHAAKSLQGLQNQMFSIFMFLVVFNTLVQQMLPNYVSQRDLYEARERPSKTFSWVAFITAQITAEIPWQILCGTMAFFCWYYPVGLYRNAPTTEQLHERGALAWLFSISFYVFVSSMGQMCVAGIEIYNNAGNLANLLFMISLNFCGVLAGPTALPGFWIFMYRVSPFTYFLDGMLSTAIANSEITCAEQEYVIFPPPSGMTCGEYMEDYISTAGGYLKSPSSTDSCSYCTMQYTNDYLATLPTSYSKRWRNWGIFICYIAINMILTVFLYWLARVPKSKNRVQNEKESDAETDLKRTQTNKNPENINVVPSQASSSVDNSVDTKEEKV
ncbi:hypothetical protein PACTADRAFT_48431 [Pachysolen tannophilus NRRL Y-2460]|uniref:ABC transporter domain-containing protein n=1 Tax=Pachysolen tannophilus NRRL Y-2460 TaxID=669874 RepID=A0A1E4TXW1_PACTA|nr:hypothetical protein PACTADRAFT_48431 [Pachysolen tannophilus NRRL Y-2460]